MAVAPHRSPSRPPARRSHLRLIQGGASRSPSERRNKKRRPRPRAGLPFAVLAFLTVGALIFGVVILNIMAAEASFRLEEVRELREAEEARYRNMRYQVATRESPEEVRRAAARLGMVVPTKQEYLVGPPGESAVAASDGRTDGEDLKALLKRP